MSLVKASATLASGALFGRVLGFARDILFAVFMGAGPIADAFFVALKLPTIVSAPFTTGAFNNAFIPQVSGLRERAGDARAIALVQQAAVWLVLALLPIVVLVQIVMPWFLYLVAPGFVEDPQRYALALEFCRLTMPYALLSSLVMLLSGAMLSFGRFAVPAYQPMVLNAFLIAAMVVAAAATAPFGHALSWAVTLSGMVQLIWLVCAFRSQGVTLRLPRPRLTPAIKPLLRALPLVGGQALLTQINLFVDTIIASLLASGAVSLLYYAERISYFPRAVVVTAISMALLPLLSRQLQAGQGEAAVNSQNRALELVLLLILPATAALIVLPESIMTVLFAHGAFSRDDAVASAAALAAYALGLPAFALVGMLRPMFLARGDMLTPFLISAVSVVVNVAVSVLLSGPFGHVGIALGTSAAFWTGALIIGFLVHRRRLFAPDQRLRRRLPRVVLASALMAAAVVPLQWQLEGLLAGTILERGVALVVLVACGSLVFAGFCHLTGAARLSDLRRVLRREFV